MVLNIRESDSDPGIIIKSIILNLCAAIIFIVGIIAFLIEEPLFGVAILVLAFLLFTPTAKLWNKILPKKARVKSILFSVILLVLGIVFSTFGRTPYHETEPTNAETISKLSVHTIKAVSLKNGMKYSYIDKGEGPTVILLHGFPDLASTWDETITELSKSHRVIAPFLRGYYPTSIPSNDEYYVKTIAEDIVSLANHLGVKKFTVVGQDWGASIAYSVANIATERVEKIVSIAIPHATCLELSPGLLFSGRHFFVLGAKGFGVRYARKMEFDYIERLYRRWSPDYKNYKESSKPIIETFKYPNRLESALGYYRSFANETEENKIFYNRIPDVAVFFMVGENDGIFSPELVTLMDEKMPKGSKVKVFKNAGHFLHREQFPEFIKELSAFIK